MRSHTSLNISTISHVVGANVASSDVLDRFKYIIVLTNASNGNSEAHIEVAVFDQDVGTVGLHRNGIVSVSDIPATEGNVVCVYNITAVSIKRTKFKTNGLVASAVDIDIFEKDVLAIDDGHSPHLRVDESGTKEVAVLSSCDGDLMRSARAISKSVRKTNAMGSRLTSYWFHSQRYTKSVPSH
jgi:hypothetical protein